MGSIASCVLSRCACKAAHVHANMHTLTCGCASVQVGWLNLDPNSKDAAERAKFAALLPK